MVSWSMKEVSSCIAFSTNQSQSGLRCSPVGECLAVLLAVIVCFTAMGWMVTLAGTLAAWIMLAACAWILLIKKE
ncbi:hypothetical protein [Thalassoglobus polymorphus]|uniref:Uncharacterized protein n=1 Tax=Thalassoglobus polymorphus TaxID=2527994 RepID=A0A517QUV6_9PLAN|nr:hypothetical protein [Thalassoglobus polymorphus]QDT35393.1 hypothetical protein Mal48_46700 [Thalassoglobus polymorphus]